MDKMKILEKVKKHLLKQNKRATGRDATCQYRGVKGTKCAIGVLIKDKYYTPELEGQSISYSKAVVTALRRSLGIKYRLKDIDLEFFNHLQAIHDYNTPKAWASQFKSLKKELENDKYN